MNNNDGREATPFTHLKSDGEALSKAPWEMAREIDLLRRDLEYVRAQNRAGAQLLNEAIERATRAESETNELRDGASAKQLRHQAKVGRDALDQCEALKALHAKNAETTCSALRAENERLKWKLHDAQKYLRNVLLEMETIVAAVHNIERERWHDGNAPSVDG